MTDIRSGSSVARVIRQFENLKTRIEKHYRDSRDFRSLCEDYAVCERALEKWQVSDTEMAVQRRQEYMELLVELQSEIHDWLEQRYILDNATEGGGPSNAK